MAVAVLGVGVGEEGKGGVKERDRGFFDWCRRNDGNTLVYKKLFSNLFLFHFFYVGFGV